ncbi:MAG: D-alanyl-D-alanine carboxypeptidase [Bacillaceae bacterium]|jgi:D-alanyl-D-alanine carboxypeptidase|uniref:serine-type D-Ala-D-Ala carboxypeptidase n=2 Tax=Aeribacillus TaxID=1055323 RepID=A0A164B357_9BACI|nr:MULTISPECIES: D-alanyl-D-alanine carboxypeptidase family protein [Aeribacillus]REJ17544.1 MAG: D-alanyl-D-alanine carboxypeptidase [Bacillaceae bacterium]KZM56898.1 D-alanyl-D-alanine carboxypeptidase [Aeribacillus pallidus]KZN95987.1 D-alanyl-D-alanine carboxypeptidase [Aeribacillus pallidus]MDR9791686.1 D-alanyl-D-alanine carboxypeptidase family protein [Aeribacillus pallidus]MDR9795643.1 D-alanyl-D-alanine carboxypeptidase family protein [Aeribacillus pallidus]
MKQLLLSVMATFVLFFGVSTAAWAEEKNVKLVDGVKSAILIERDTGQVLYEENSDTPLPPASMTKIMTLLLIMEALDKGKIQMDEKVRASEYAASMGGSQIFLEPGEEMTVEDLLKGIAIASGNDASVAMAERIAGSEEQFVSMMNQKAKELGLKNTHFKNSTGLPAKGHYSSAKDMAVIAKELLKYEEITKFTGTYEDYLREGTDKKFWLVNTNRLVKFYDGVDGVKTGYTNEAKYCLTATAKKGNMRVIAVVFGAKTPKDRNAQITKLLDYAFSQYETHPLFKRNEVVTKAKLSKGSDKDVQLITSEPVSIITKKGESIDDIKQEIMFKNHLVAPVKKGDELGTLVLKKNGKVFAESKLVAKQDVRVASWWKLFKRVLGEWTKAEK